MKPRVRVKAFTRMYRADNIPEDARPGDLILGNRGAGAIVKEYGSNLPRTGALNVEYAGNFGMGDVRNPWGGKVYDLR